MLNSTCVFNRQLFYAFIKERKTTIIFVMPVGPSIRMAQLGSYWTDFLGI